MNRCYSARGENTIYYVIIIIAEASVLEGFLFLHKRAARAAADRRYLYILLLNRSCRIISRFFPIVKYQVHAGSVHRRVDDSKYLCKDKNNSYNLVRILAMKRKYNSGEFWWGWLYYKPTNSVLLYKIKTYSRLRL